MTGYIGKLIRVNLRSGHIREECVDDGTFRKFLGGKGLAGKILLEELDPRVNALGPSNKLLFLTGPLTGTGYPGSGKHLVSARSPLTGIWGESVSGGYWGPELKFAGYDGIVVEGKATNPVYLWIHDQEVEIRDATELWGENIVQATKQIQEETNRHARVACIGLAGEKKVRFACIIHDMNHAAGRTGLGAVMGSKNLKGISVFGSNKRLNIVNRQKFKELLLTAYQILKKSDTAQSYHKYGTSGAIPALNALGILPTKYFQSGVFEGSERISGETMAKTILVGRTTCMGCPIACIRAVEIESKHYGKVTSETGGPQYETIAAFGSLCLNDDLESIAKAHQLCNLYGLDTISTGNIIAFLMACSDKGLLTKKEMNGIEIGWGKTRDALEMIKRIADRDGFGDLLAQGLARASKKIGRKAAKLAMHVKGMEIPLHDPRGKKGLGLFYAVSSRGACHLGCTHDTAYVGKEGLSEVDLRGEVDRFSVEGKGRFVKITEDLMAICNSAVICRFPTVVLNPVDLIPMTLITKILASVTGWDITLQELRTVGERAVNLTRIFNARRGMNRKDDILPPQLMEELPEGASKGQKISKKDLNKMLDEYYSERGWDNQGIPTQEKLAELQISELARRQF